MAQEFLHPPTEVPDFWKLAGMTSLQTSTPSAARYMRHGLNKLLDMDGALYYAIGLQDSIIVLGDSVKGYFETLVRTYLMRSWVD